MIKDIGAVTVLFSPFSCQVVFIDIESLPTGTVIPNSGQIYIPTVLTASYKPASSPGWPFGAIQLADNLTLFSSPISAAAMLVTASATAKRADAA